MLVRSYSVDNMSFHLESSNARAVCLHRSGQAGGKVKERTKDGQPSRNVERKWRGDISLMDIWR